MHADQKRVIVTETVIATCLCSLLPALAVYFFFEPFPVPLWGADGLVAFAAKSTGVAVCLMTALMTLGTRGKVSKGAVAPLVRGRIAWLAWVPRSLPLRVPLFAACAVVLLTAATAAGVVLFDPAPLGREPFFVFNLVIGALIGLGMTPLIQCAALSDVTPAAAHPAPEIP